ncbi:MAG: hypothetical protein J3R72DRAFT_454641 [Linnemannia gamsii]|nr:MAG: hypothetical protein J3R72DRAFT_454641 [Linnemannia gamsii]
MMSRAYTILFALLAACLLSYLAAATPHPYPKALLARRDDNAAATCIHTNWSTAKTIIEKYMEENPVTDEQLADAGSLVEDGKLIDNPSIDQVKDAMDNFPSADVAQLTTLLGCSQ